MMLTSVPLSPSSFLPTSPHTPLAFSHAASDDLFDLLPSSYLTLAAFFRRYEPRLLEFLTWFKQAGFVLVRDLCSMTSEERRHLYRAVSGPPMPYSLQIRLERLIIADMGLSISGKNVSTQTSPINCSTEVRERVEPQPPDQPQPDRRPILKEQWTQWDLPVIDRTSSESSCTALELLHQSNIFQEKSPERGGDKEGAAIFECPRCEMKFTRKGSLTVHYRKHTGYHPFSCDMENCSLTFRSKTTLDRHRKAHESQRIIVCEICKKEFKTSSALNKHRVIHDNVKAFQCPTCDKLFRRKDHLDVHLLTHSSHKKFSCDLCPKRFKQKSGLLVHKKSHELDLECRLCSQKFTSKESLCEHSRQHFLPA